MKIISVLAVVQVVVLLALWAKVSSVEDRVDKLATSRGQIPQTEVTTGLPQPEQLATQAGVDSQQLRRILQEELRVIKSNSELLAQNSNANPKQSDFDEIEMQYKHELVMEELEMLKGQVDVSSGELDKLMGDIAQLDPQRRTESMKMLNQAMNRGEIKGRL